MWQSSAIALTSIRRVRGGQVALVREMFRYDHSAQISLAARRARLNLDEKEVSGG
jgi:hypothetical protein